MSVGTESPRPDNRASILPTGTVTFLVADVDQSAGRGFEPAAGAWPQLHRVVDATLAAHGGRLSQTVSASNTIAVFESATDAVAAVMDLRAAVREGAELQALGRGLRMALHMGQARIRDDGWYIGAAVRTGERLVEIANGGQTLVSTLTGAVRPWFTLDASSEAAVRTMCSRLDGIPLALELAAAWLRTLTPQQIEAGLDDRFALLVRGPRGAVPRQQTLAASIEWSHALLEESDRIVFRRLAVFAGGFGLEAARSVGAAGVVARDDVLDAVGRLVDKSLVVAEERGGEARYRLLETIRQFAADRLDEAGEVAVTRDRHLAHVLAFAEAIEPQLQRDMDAWRTQLELEYGNLRAALDWGLAAPDPEPGRRLAATLPWLWHLHGHGPEGIDFLRRAVRRAPGDRSRLQARLLTGIALVADTASPLDLEFDAAQRALTIATEQGDEPVRVVAASDRARDAMASPRDPVQQLACDTTVPGLRAALGDRAFTEAWAEGARLTLDDAVAYVRRARGIRRRPSTGWGSLTPTELDVVRLVVDGLNNPEIGSRLFMSRGTVKTHLSHIYAKLGVANRTELATLTTARATRS